MNYTKLEQIKLKIIKRYGEPFRKSFITTNDLSVMENNLKRFTVYQNYNNKIRIYYHNDFLDFDNVSSVMDFIKNNILGE